ncbi:hypothetical protein [Staphylococcus pettenkoferi]|nr:hypothetical protein [Staphylococcus pettenkoferi]MCY1591148.1 hypothetical protein [Staphylococcus pettenkoferi]MCY1598309.1 hypothetical protein [Staphylococcus pettenkoferi]MCY1600596.1 hypothetical protein [Staphylococcus pettenkoferi]MCY1609863.1 hypothetical protein [Staphylococcus pettenkoferi]MCY1614487.1 hypothetical protein [Staphylococcus pettenkoferi]
MKFTKLGIFIGFIALFIILAGCQSQEDKEKEFKKQTNLYIDKLAKNVDKVDKAGTDNPEDHKKIISATDKANKQIKSDFKKYKEDFNKDALDNKDNKKIYQNVSNITDIYTQSYDNLHKISKAEGLDKESFAKHALNEFTNSYVALGTQMSNLEKSKAKKILNEKAYDHLKSTIDRSTNEVDTVAKGYAMLQGQGFDLKAEDMPKFDAVKYGKYHKDGETKEVSADKYNQLADKANKIYDKDSQVPHVDKSVNELSYKLLEEKYNYAKAVKELVDSLSEAA